MPTSWTGATSARRALELAIETLDLAKSRLEQIQAASLIASVAHRYVYELVGSQPDTPWSQLGERLYKQMDRNGQIATFGRSRQGPRQRFSGHAVYERARAQLEREQLQRDLARLESLRREVQEQLERIVAGETPRKVSVVRAPIDSIPECEAELVRLSTQIAGVQAGIQKLTHAIESSSVVDFGPRDILQARVDSETLRYLASDDDATSEILSWPGSVAEFDAVLSELEGERLRRRDRLDRTAVATILDDHSTQREPAQ